MARLADASGWVFFDVLARDSATGARVAMWLRERLPEATIGSAPDSAGSSDPQRPHLLHCRAYVNRRSSEQTRATLEAALTNLDLVASDEPQARAHVVFLATPAQAEAA
jgi:hypothetical protein